MALGHTRQKLLWTTDQGARDTEYHLRFFASSVELKLLGWKCTALSGAEPCSGIERRRALAPLCIAWRRDLQDALGKNIPLPVEHLEEGILPFIGQKTQQVPANGLLSAGD